MKTTVQVTYFWKIINNIYLGFCLCHMDRMTVVLNNPYLSSNRHQTTGRDTYKFGCRHRKFRAQSSLEDIAVHLCPWSHNRYLSSLSCIYKILQCKIHGRSKSGGGSQCPHRTFLYTLGHKSIYRSHSDRDHYNQVLHIHHDVVSIPCLSIQDCTGIHH